MAFSAGLYDAIEEGEFYWTADCALPDYSNWNGTNHPKTDDEECVSIDNTGLWHDNDCAVGVAGYICEQKDRRELLYIFTAFLRHGSNYEP